MKIIVAGGTGFVGKALVRGLIEDGHQVIIAHRSGSKTKPPEQSGVEVVTVDLEKPIDAGDLVGDAIINLVAIIREYPARGITFFKTNFLVTKNLIDFAVRNHIGQFLQMSALGVAADSKTAYEQTKYSAERYVAESGLNWTIYRPSIIIGPGGLVDMLTEMIRRLPVVPVIGHGQYKVQPVYIEDVCAGFRRALGNERARGRVFEIGGPEVMTFDQMLDTLGEVMGHPDVRKWHQPVWMIRPLAALLGRFPWFPLSNEQITMLLENNYTYDNSYFEFFGIMPRRLKDGLEEIMR